MSTSLNIGPQLPLPDTLAPYVDLLSDLRWTWSHAGDAMWKKVDPNVWSLTKNPYAVLENLSLPRLEALSRDRELLSQLERLAELRKAYMADPGWYGESHGESPLKGVAYFSMEFGVGEALPLYAGGLGVLAGDYLKTASDLGVPVVGIGLLYSQGYFRQVLDSDGWQREAYPYNGDGIDDILIGARNAALGAGPQTGEVFVVFGTEAGFPAVLPLPQLLPSLGGDGSSGFVIRGVNSGEFVGHEVSTADINGDGISDIIIGTNAELPQDTVYVVYGRAGFPAVYPLSRLSATQ